MTIHQKGISIPKPTYEKVKARADAAGTSVSAWLDGAARGRLAREASAAYAVVVSLAPVAEKITAFRNEVSGARTMQAAPSAQARPRRTMRYGEIWEIAGVRVLIISSDDYNEHPENPPLVVAVIDDPAFSLAAPLVVGAGGADPIVGSILVPEFRPWTGPSAEAESLGMMSPATMMAVGDGMRTMLEL